MTPCGHCNAAGTVHATTDCVPTNATRCDCLDGWGGAICERCADGYAGSPHIWGGCLPSAGGSREDGGGDAAGPWQDVSAEEAEAEADWRARTEIGCAALVSTSILCLLVLCFCC